MTIGRIRIAVGGPLNIGERGTALRETLTGVLDQIKRASGEAVRGSANVDLVVLSQLAPGVDQLAAEVGLNAGHRIEAVLPAPVDAYAASLLPNFPTAVGDLRRFVQIAEEKLATDSAISAGVWTMPGEFPSGEDPAAAAARRSAYERATVEILGIADVVVAVLPLDKPDVVDRDGNWSRIGTEFQVYRALQYGLPVIWIPWDDCRTVSILDISAPHYLKVMQSPPENRLMWELLHGGRSSLSEVVDHEPIAASLGIVIEEVVRRKVAIRKLEREIVEFEHLAEREGAVSGLIRWQRHLTSKAWNLLFERPLIDSDAIPVSPLRPPPQSQWDWLVRYLWPEWPSLWAISRAWFWGLVLDAAGDRRARDTGKPPRSLQERLRAGPLLTWLLGARSSTDDAVRTDDAYGAIQKFCSALRRPVSDLATYYQGLHRTSVVLILVLLMLSSILAAAATLARPDTPGGSSVPQPLAGLAGSGLNKVLPWYSGPHVVRGREMAAITFRVLSGSMLFAAVVIYGRAMHLRWQQKALDLRLNSERMRHVPIFLSAGVEPLSLNATPIQYTDRSPGKSWLDMHFRRCLQVIRHQAGGSIPPPGELARRLAQDRDARQKYRRLCRSWLQMQYSWHERTARAYGAIFEFIESAQKVIVLITFAFSAILLWLRVPLLDFAVVVAPAFGTAFGALVSQVELNRLRERYAAMDKVLRRYDRLLSDEWLDAIVAMGQVDWLRTIALEAADAAMDEAYEFRILMQLRPVSNPL